MKKFYIPFILCALLLSVLASCKKGGFLEQTVTTNLNEETVFADSAYTEGFIANIYSNVGFSANATRFGNGGMDAATDEGEVAGIKASTAVAFASGTINGATVSEGAYDICYKNIRAINKVLKYLPTTPLKDRFKTLRTAEMHFLRAWYYAMLLKHYGGVPLIGDTIYEYTQQVNVKRDTYEACVNYILAEIKKAEDVLPVIQKDVSLGRASRGSCLALKARVLLYAASPLFNGTTLASGELQSIVGYPTADASRWRAAADAAARVMLLGEYKLVTEGSSTIGPAFVTLFTQRFNTEYLFQLMRPTNNTDLENVFLPPSRAGNGEGAFPYQQLVDAFPMNTGIPITDPSSGYDINNPYANRDPRLDFTVVHDQSVMAIRTSDGGQKGTSPVNIFIGNYNGIETGRDAVRLGTPTGYYTNKMLSPNATGFGFWNTTSRCIPLLRYAEVLLNYAEAVNEIGGPNGRPNIDAAGLVTPYEIIIQIRKRAGILPGTNEKYGLPEVVNKAQMREIIHNERRIELAFEEHRFWDVRRWKIAEQTENLKMTGMEVRRNESEVTYTPFLVRKHNFFKAMYLWPLPDLEISKAPKLLQNPGY